MPMPNLQRAQLQRPQPRSDLSLWVWTAYYPLRQRSHLRWRAEGSGVKLQSWRMTSDWQMGQVAAKSLMDRLPEQELGSWRRRSTAVYRAKSQRLMI